MRNSWTLALLGALLLAGGVARAEPQAPEVITMEQAVSRALTRNPNLRVANEEIRRAQSLVEQSRAASLPALTANGAYSRLEGTGTLENGNANIDRSLSSANVTFTVPLVQPRAWAQWGQARQGVDVARLSASEARRELAATVARTYLSILTQRRVIEVSQRARATAEAHHSFAHQRFAGGFGTRVDEVRAAEEVATDQAQLEAAQALLTRLRESLGVLCGIDHPVDVTEEVNLPEPPLAGEAEQEAQLQREDIKLSRGRLELARKIRRDSFTDYLPSVGVTIAPFWQTDPTLLLPGQGWQAQLGVTWQLYDGGLRYGLLHERRSLEREAELGLENIERQASADVRAADDEVRHSAAALASARSAATLAAEALALTNRGYQAGASTNIEVIDAERRARDADTAVAQAEDAWRQALLDLLLATGRFPQKS